MFSVDSSPTSSCSSPNSAVTSPGISTEFAQMRVVPPEDTPARRQLFFGRNDVEDTSENGQMDALLETSAKIRKLDLPLVGCHEHDVYFIKSPTRPQAVFKPGKENAVKALLCRNIAVILELEASVPLTIKAKAGLIMSREDIDEQGKPIVYKKVFVEGKPWVAHSNDCYPILTKNHKSVSLRGGCDFTIEKEDEGYNLVPKTKNAHKHPLQHELVLFATIDGDEYIIKYETAKPVFVDLDGAHIKKGNQRFEMRLSQDADDLCCMQHSGSEDDLFEKSTQSETLLESRDSPEIPDSVNLLRRDVKGFLQPMIPSVTDIDGVAIDIFGIKKTREVFFSKINLPSFINSFLLAILFRTEDGKAHDLRDSNFLFTDVDDQFFLTMIDHDETWPPSNAVSEAPELQAEGPVTTLRLGLMGYPQAHAILQGEDKAYVLSVLQKISQRKVSLLEALDGCQLNDQTRVKLAFNEVLESLAVFDINSDFCLADIVFHVFTIYKEQWMELEKDGRSREQIAANLGNTSVAMIKKMRK